MRIRSIGAAAIIAYFGLFYFLPIIIMAVIGPHKTLAYKGDVILSGGIVLAVFGLSFLFAKTGVRMPTGWARRLPNVFKNRVIVFGLILITIPISMQFHTEFGAGFRYSGGGLVSAGFVPQYMFLYKSFFYSYILYWFFCTVSGHRATRTDRVGIFLHSIAWGLSANGSADIVWVGTALILSVFGPRSRKYFVHRIRPRGDLIRAAIDRFKVAPFLLVGAFGLILFGFANKMGLDAAIERLNVENVSAVGYYLYYRISVFIAAIEYTLSYGWIDLQFYGRSIDTLVDMVVYRSQTIMGFYSPKPIYGGINQLNYLEIFNAPANLRSGSSPGVIASFLYLPFIPANLIAGAIYVAAMMNSFTRAAPIKAGNRPSILAMFFLIFASFSLLHSPLEAFLKVGPELFTTLLILYALEKASRAAKSDFVS